MNLEILKYSMSRLDKLITDADNKASFLLAYSIAVLGGEFLFLAKDISRYNCVFVASLTITFLVFTSSVLFAFLTIFPRTKREQANTPYINGAPEKSILFFLDILKIDSTKDKLNKLSSEADFLNQMKQSAQIVERKLKFLKFSVYCAAVGTLFTLVVFMMSLI